MSGWVAAAAASVALAVLVGTGSGRRLALSRLAARPGRSDVALRTGQSWQPSREEARRRAAVLRLVESLGVELRSGADPREALHASCRGSPMLEVVAWSAATPSADVCRSLHAVGALPGGQGATDLAVLWSVCEASGAGLAEPARRLATGLRDGEQVRREVAAQLAGPRATAWLLAALPLFGLSMGAALGAAPWTLLTGPVGPLLLVPGLGLELVGLLWTRRLTRRAQRAGA